MIFSFDLRKLALEPAFSPSFLVKECSGAILVFVLWVLAVLSVIAGYYSLESRLFRDVSAGPWFALKNRLAAESLMKLVAALEGSYNSDTDEKDGIGRDEAQDEESRIISYDGSHYRIRIGGQHALFSVEDERGKLDLNRASEDEIRGVIEGLLTENQPDRAKIIVDSILDWRDNDDDRRFHGAEDGYYRRLEPSYHAADRKFLFLDELLLVRGVGFSIFYGPIEVAGDEEAPSGRQAAWRGGLQDIFTVYNRSDKVLEGAAPLPLLLFLDPESLSDQSGPPGVLRLKARVNRGRIQAFFELVRDDPKGFRLLYMSQLPDL
jgi:hypothetical protein